MSTYEIVKNTRDAERELRSGRISTSVITTWDVVDTASCRLVSEHWRLRDAKAALAALVAPKPLNRVYAVNRELKALGETPRLRAGRGYYYFDGDACGWPSSSVYVCYGDDLTVEQWLGEYRDLKATAVAWGRA